MSGCYYASMLDYYNRAGTSPLFIQALWDCREVPNDSQIRQSQSNVPVNLFRLELFSFFINKSYLLLGKFQV